MYIFIYVVVLRMWSQASSISIIQKHTENADFNGRQAPLTILESEAQGQRQPAAQPPGDYSRLRLSCLPLSSAWALVH